MDDKNRVKETSKKKKDWGSGGGLYRGLKASVKSLNRIIIILMIALVAVVIYLSTTGSYTTTFELNGGENISAEHNKYGEYIDVETPVKTGYQFAGWYQDKDLSKEWDLKKDIVEDNMTLYAKWNPTRIHVLFDTDGGLVENQEIISAKDVLFHEPYGELPTPAKDGYTFNGWEYNGERITSKSIVSMNGEHTLKAIYK